MRNGDLNSAPPMLLTTRVSETKDFISKPLLYKLTFTYSIECPLSVAVSVFGPD